VERGAEHRELPPGDRPGHRRIDILLGQFERLLEVVYPPLGVIAHRIVTVGNCAIISSERMRETSGKSYEMM
jgi:hypothetical protein